MKVGLNYHQSVSQIWTKTYEERLPPNVFEQFLTISKVKLANNECFEIFGNSY